MAHSQGFVAFKLRGAGAVAPGSIALWPMAGFVFVDPELNYATRSFETIHCTPRSAGWVSYHPFVYFT